MVDRVACTLDIGGRVTPAAIAALSEAIDAEQPDYIGGDRIVEGLMIGCTFAFQEMANGDLPEALRSALIDGGFAFAWDNDQGPDTAPGVVLHDPTTGETASYHTILGEIALAGDAITDEIAVADAIRWGAFHRQLPPLELTEPQKETL